MHESSLARRKFLAAGAAALVPMLGGNAVAAEAGERAFKLKETAGLRRFGYPVYTTIPLDPGSLKFRLERNGQAIPAQFRAIDPGDGKVITALDFNASPGPLDSESYVVRYGPDVKPGPEPKAGMSVEHGDGAWIVRNKGSMSYVVPDNLGGVLRSVLNGKLEYVKPGGLGLAMRTPNEDLQVVGAGNAQNGQPTISSKVVRNGPLAIGLRFLASVRFEALGLVQSQVDMTFPSSKSWVEVNWTVNDPRGWITDLTVGLNLQVQGEPVMVDFGARNTVYGTLRGAERMSLRAGVAPGFSSLKGGWEVSKGKSLFATGTSAQAEPTEGWAHVMDQKRCTAIAVAEFGRASRDAIHSGGDGQLELDRASTTLKSPPVPGTKSLHFWLHFVPMPVQVGAVTSPQAMLAPLVVEWGKPKGG